MTLVKDNPDWPDRTLRLFNWHGPGESTCKLLFPELPILLCCSSSSGPFSKLPFTWRKSFTSGLPGRHGLWFVWHGHSEYPVIQDLFRYLPVLIGEPPPEGREVKFLPNLLSAIAHMEPGVVHFFASSCFFSSAISKSTILLGVPNALYQFSSLVTGSTGPL